MKISIEDAHKTFDGFRALRGVSLEVGSGELVALLGPSGSGKTTLLRTIAGLENLTGGRILFGEDDASTLSVQERHVGFVFQHYALFKHMSVFENIAFGLRIMPRGQRPKDRAIRDKVLDLLALVQLSGLEKRFPGQLSGGQRQRVALARALAIDPKVLLLDEPFGALDAKVRKELRAWLREVHDRTGHTTLFVTHDQEEALDLADRVVVMHQGKIEQVGTPDALYNTPETAFVYGFLGETNVVPVAVRGGAAFLQGQAEPVVTGASVADGPATLFVRPHDFQLSDVRSGALPAVVKGGRSLLGSHRLEVQADGLGQRIEVLLRDTDRRPPIGSAVLLKAQRYGLFPATT